MKRYEKIIRLVTIRPQTTFYAKIEFAMIPPEFLEDPVGRISGTDHVNGSEDLFLSAALRETSRNMHRGLILTEICTED